MNKPYPTPHIAATPDDFAETVIMPGDPLRAKFIAENYLDSARCVNNVRGICGYTGYYRSNRITVMASGMGAPSIGIYSYELYNFFDVENIIRIGSAGSIRSDIAVRDIVLGQGSCTNSNYAAQYGLQGSFAPICDYRLLDRFVRRAEQMGLKYHVGNLLCSDTFYSDDSAHTLEFGKMGVMAVEMESAALYMNAARAGKRALCVCTVSDSLITGESMTADERQNTLTDMIELALSASVEL